MGLHESGCLRSTLEYFGISIGSRTNFSVEVPAISGYDPEIYIRIPSHNVIRNRNIVTNWQQSSRLSIYKVQGEFDRYTR